MNNLEITGLAIKDDPYSPSKSGERSSDIRYWMKIEYVNIFSYFTAKPGTFNFKHLASRRQLEAYNYFKNNYVQIIFSATCDSGTDQWC